MLEPKLLRYEVEKVADLLKVRGFELDSKLFNQLEEQRKTLQVAMQDLQHQRKQLSKQIGIAKGKGEEASELMQSANELSEQLEKSEQKFEEIKTQLEELQYEIPNLPHESVPPGKSDADNVEIRKWGTIPSFDFEIKDHVDIGESLGMMDFTVSAKLSGSRFVVLKNQLVRLQRALTQFMLDVHSQEHGYEEIYVPFLVHAKALYGTGQLPKFHEDQFKIVSDHDYFLIPTAEVPVTNTVRESILEPEQLPMQYVAHTPCFRREAGSYGKDTRGLIRQHQFEKVELVWVVKPEESFDVLEKLTQHAETILQKLGLAYRVVTLCGGDLGFSATKTYDLEVWLPSQNCYREISSCSNCTDFQARRMQARYRDPATGKPELVHTLNGSGLAVGRTLVAIIENYQDEKGQIHIPEVLQPYMGGLKLISSK